MQKEQHLGSGGEWGGGGCGLVGVERKYQSFICFLGSKTQRLRFCSAESKAVNQRGGKEAERSREQSRGHLEGKHSSSPTTSAEGESAAQRKINHVSLYILKHYYLKI